MIYQGQAVEGINGTWADYSLFSESIIEKRDDFFPQVQPESFSDGEEDDDRTTLYRGSLFQTCGGRIWGIFYRMEPKYKGSQQLIDNKMSAYGAVLGYEMRLQKRANLSFYYNYGYKNSIKTLDFDSKLQNHIGGLKFRKRWNNLAILLGGSGGVDQYDYRYNTVPEKIERDGFQARGYVELMYNNPNFNIYGITVKPFVTYQYDYLERKSLQEEYGHLAYSEKIKHDTSQILLGSRFEWKWFDFRLAWIRNLDDGKVPIRNQWFSSYSGTTTPTQLYYEGSSGTDRLWFGFGGKYVWFNRLAVFIDYDLQYHSDESSHIGSAGVCYSW